MAIFDRMERTLSRTIDRTFSIRFVLWAKTSTPNGRYKYDTDRSNWIGKGILEQNAADVPAEIGRRDRAGNSLQSLVNGHTTEFSVDTNSYAFAHEARQGDQIQLDDLRKFQITETRRDGMSRVVWVLSELN
ncbi:hypothetical protein [Ochrobactrum sp. MYb379]|uniref:hypothetical protein n=1 Tax=Ochrobactrum sp. MYb379 TaxID=2745275 RepID=UPI0030AB9A35